MTEDEDMLELLDEDEEQQTNDDLSTDEEITETSHMEAMPSDEETDTSPNSEIEDTEKDEGSGIEIDIKYIIIGAIVIIGIIAAIGILFFLPVIMPGVPQVDISSSQQGEEVILVHNGGTPLELQNLQILLDGIPMPESNMMILGGGTWPWTQGEAISIMTDGYVKPANLTVEYSKNNQMYLLYSTTAIPTPTPTPTPVVTVEPTPEPVPEINTTSSSLETGYNPADPEGIRLAGMKAVPSKGLAPLTVQFTDTTSVCINDRRFDFGDGQYSNRRYPDHIYPFAGSYNVSLNLDYCDPDDYLSVPANGTITVLPVERKDTLLSGRGYANVPAGASIYFTVKGPGTNIRIGGKDYAMNVSDMVELDLNSGGRGDISIISNAFIKCDYEDVTLKVNGEEVTTGWITGININQFDKIAFSNFTIEIEAFEPGLSGMVNAVPVDFAKTGELLKLVNVGPDSTGKLLFSVQDQSGFNFRGGIEDYEISTPAWKQNL